MKGLYIHIPFCEKKCKYCDFNSFCASIADKNQYITALIDEMEKYKGTKCDTVFMGGGTPTALDTQNLFRVLEAINRNFVISDKTEFTAEVNPKTVDENKLKMMLENGVNRLSVGVQSLNDAELSAIGRIHSASDAEETIHMARKCGFENISIDLMSALPNQTMESFSKTLEKAVKLNTEHISCYSLILEEGTPLYKEYKNGKLILPDEDTEREMYEYACDFLKKNGYFQYEISNFAKPGKCSRHNLKYWNCDEYIGIGLSAHSYLDGVRFSNTGDFKQYISGDYFSEEREVLSEKDKMSEYMFMGLRKTEGVSKTEFSKRFSAEMEEIFSKPVLKYKKWGMIIDENDFLQLSKKAISVSNQIMCDFIL